MVRQEPFSVKKVVRPWPDRGRRPCIEEILLARRKSWHLVLLDDREKLELDTANPQNPFCLFVCLFACLRLNGPSQQFFSHVRMEPMLPGFDQCCRELMCLAQGHNMVLPVEIEPRTSRFGVGCSTTMPPHSLQNSLELRSHLRRRLVKKVQPSVEDSGLFEPRREKTGLRGF